MRLAPLFTMLILFLTCSCASSKKNITSKESNITNKEYATTKVEYIFKFKPRKYVLEQKCNLFIGNQSSLFEYNKGKEPFVVVDGESGQDGFMQDEIGDLIYKDFNLEKINIREKILGKPFITEESLPKIKWKIEKEKKKIGSFVCQLATTFFRGRKYNAWFTKEISYSDGPWKFNGLPGLILEVYDEKFDYQFIFKSITTLENNTTMINFTNNGIQLSFDDFIKVEDVEFEKLKKLAEAKWDGEGEFKMTKNPSNPIELNYND